MNWNRAGRPKGATQKDPNWSDKELTVHKNGVQALAAAVFEQWEKDGKPAADKEGAEIWQKISQIKSK